MITAAAAHGEAFSLPLHLLTDTQKRILRLLAIGDYTQSRIAKVIGVSRQYVSRVIKKLHALNIIKPKDNRRYNIWYDVAPEVLPALIPQQDEEEETPTISACRVHNIRLKYRITHQSGPVCLDPRAGYLRSWKMRGGRRHKFIIPGPAGKLDITIDVHPGTLVAYPDAGQSIILSSIDDSEAAIIAAIHEAVQTFIEKQAQFNVYIRIMNPSKVGKVCSSPHYGFSTTAKDQNTHLVGFWIDGSPAAHGDPDHAEFETRDREKATALDQAVQNMIKSNSLLRSLVDRIRSLEGEVLSLRAAISS